MSHASDSKTRTQELKDEFAGFIRSIKNKILVSLQEKALESSENTISYQAAILACKTLLKQLKASGDEFFSAPNHTTLLRFQAQLHNTLDVAGKEFKHHRSAFSIAHWDEFHPIIKGILGILAALTVDFFTN